MPRTIRLRLPAETLTFRRLQRWRSWAHARTSSSGSYRYNACDPSCTSSSYRRTTARITLSALRACGSLPTYRRLRYDPLKSGLATVTLGIDCAGQAEPLSYSPRRP